MNISKEVCDVCGKTAYLNERIAADNKTFHKNCLRCTHCNKILSLGNYAALQGKYYCKPHFKQLFALKGNYNEGFGTEKHTKNWDTAYVPGMNMSGVDFTKGKVDSPKVKSKAEDSPRATPERKESGEISHVSSSSSSSEAPSSPASSTSVAPASSTSVAPTSSESSSASSVSSSPGPKKLSERVSSYNNAVSQKTEVSTHSATPPASKLSERVNAYSQSTSSSSSTNVSGSGNEIKTDTAPAASTKLADRLANYTSVAQSEGSVEKRINDPVVNPDIVVKQGPSLSERKGAFAEAESKDVKESPAPIAKSTSAKKFEVKKELCAVCGKIVYPLEKISADEVIFHKNCFKCAECGRGISPGNYAGLGGKYYCKPHFKQLFKAKGDYSSGFGEEDAKKKWGQAAYVPPTVTNFVPVEKPKESKPIEKKVEQYKQAAATDEHPSKPTVDPADLEPTKAVHHLERVSSYKQAAETDEHPSKPTVDPAELEPVKAVPNVVRIVDYVAASITDEHPAKSTVDPAELEAAKAVSNVERVVDYVTATIVDEHPAKSTVDPADLEPTKAVSHEERVIDYVVGAATDEHPAKPTVDPADLEPTKAVSHDERVDEYKQAASTDEHPAKPTVDPADLEPAKAVPLIQRADSYKNVAANAQQLSWLISSAAKRINPNPSKADIDLRHPSIIENYSRILDPNGDISWFIIEYDDMDNFIASVKRSGNGDYNEMLNNFTYDKPFYAYLKTPQFKFVFVSYIPDSLSALKKNKIRAQEKQVETFIEKKHTEIRAMDNRGLQPRVFQDAISRISRA